MKSWVDDIFESYPSRKELHIKDTSGDVQVLKRFRILYSCEEVLMVFLPNLVIDREGLKKPSQEFLKKFGTSPSSFKRVFNKLMREMWVTPIETFVNRYGFRKVPCYYGKAKKTGNNPFMSKTQWKPSISPLRVAMIWEAKDLLEQSEKDGLKNVQPLLWSLKMAPPEAKKFLGKGLWKRVCKQSYTRNRAIGKLLVNDQLHGLKERVEILTQFPSRFLVRGGNSPVPLDNSGLIALELCPVYVAHSGRRHSNAEFHRIHNMVEDTARMATRLGIEVNPKWSLTKWEEKHEEFTSQIELGRFSKIRFEWCDEGWVDTHYSYLYDMPENEIEVTYELICNAWSVRKEGQDMHHCVSMYAESCTSGAYLVYQVFVNGEKHSTLGLRRNKAGGQIKFEQQYKACNGDVGNWMKDLSREFSKRLSKASEEFMKEKLPEVA